MRRRGVEDVKGGTPIATGPANKQPRRRLSKAELREQADAAFPHLARGPNLQKPSSVDSERGEALRQVAFDERCKIHDLLIEGVELALKKRGYPALAEMKAKWQRKER